MSQLSAWMGAGVVAAGMSAAMIAGADAASADTGADAGGTSTSTSETPNRGPRAAQHSARDTRSTDTRSTDTDTTDNDEDTRTVDADGEDTDVDETDADVDVSDVDTDSEDAKEVDDPDVGAPDSESESTPLSVDETSDEATDDVEDSSPAVRTGRHVVDKPESAPLTSPAVPRAVANETTAQRMSPVRTTSAAVSAPQRRTLEEVIQSLVTDLVGAAIRVVAGPPVVPPGVDVTVRSSRLEITEGRFVRADWYYPDGDELPERFIYLQHGYRGVGAMYSYTASWLAERTNSIVVVPTLSSNPYVRDGFWLGDDQVYRATAELLLGDREALTASAVAAGFARHYGATAALPDRFTLVGHSLGAGVAAGAAGYYAEAMIASGATNQLAGIMTLDGAPPGTVLADALDKLDGLGVYIPVFELGAPREDGSPRRVDQALNEHRPGHFNGVVLDNGQHLDSMQGGSRAIQLISYLNQGFPTEENKSAAQTLMAGWLNDIFAGRIDPATGACGGGSCAGIYGSPGDEITVATPVGAATGTVIGTSVTPSSARFRPAVLTSLMSSRSAFLRVAVAG